MGTEQVASTHAGHDETSEILGNLASLDLEWENGSEKGELELAEEIDEENGQDLRNFHNLLNFNFL